MKHVIFRVVLAALTALFVLASCVTTTQAMTREEMERDMNTEILP